MAKTVAGSVNNPPVRKRKAPRPRLRSEYVVRQDDLKNKSSKVLVTTGRLLEAVATAKAVQSMVDAKKFNIVIVRTTVIPPDRMKSSANGEVEE